MRRKKGDAHLCLKNRERKTTTDRKGEAEEGEEQGDDEGENKQNQSD